jgi:MoaA/NifB/PqqE/SkfB family radical SAM enzyme
MLKEDVKIIELELSTLCGASCPLCYRNYKVFDDHYPETIVRPLEDIQNQICEYPNLEEILLVGSISEPTLYQDFQCLVEFIKSKGIKIEICTNGDTQDEGWWYELASLLTPEDGVYFTVCGSTQEIHEVYRRGTSLKRILENADAYRQGGKGNDYAQCIRFEYNDDDFESDEFKSMVGVFSNVYMTETFLLKDESIYKDTTNLDKLKPMKSKQEQYFKIDKLSRVLFERGNTTTTCKAQEGGMLQIDVHGKVYPCYLFLEASNGKEWDGDWDDIKNLKHEVCRFCQKHVHAHCKNSDTEYII